MGGLLSLLGAGRQVIGGGAAPYSALAVDFDGTNDYLTRGADFTGLVDGKKGTISFWVRLDGGDGTNQVIYSSEGSPARVLVFRLSSNVFEIRTYTSGGSAVVNLATVSTFTASSTWLHIVISWDAATPGARHLYVNDVLDLNVIAFNDLSIDYTRVNHVVGAVVGGSLKLNGCLADLWFDPTTYIDLSIEANRRKFIDASGKPVDLGANGEIPTGSSPILFLSGDSTDFATNKGTGGGMTTTGALTDASTSPSD